MGEVELEIVAFAAAAETGIEDAFEVDFLAELAGKVEEGNRHDIGCD